MFEAYSEMGPPNILFSDYMSGLASFFVVAVGGTIIGVVWGFLTALVTRYTHEVRVIEPIFIFVMAYLAYLNAEIFHMSGILAITFCGITMKNYVEANISHKSHTTVKYAMKMLSSSSETIIFMFLGVATVNDSHDWNTWFVVLTIFFCSVFRVLVAEWSKGVPIVLDWPTVDGKIGVRIPVGSTEGVILLTAVVNRFRLYKLNKVEKFVMSYGGLRGAVAFALVLLIDPKHVRLAAHVRHHHHRSHLLHCLLPVHPTEIRTSISPSSTVELNTISALVNYATEAGNNSLGGNQLALASTIKHTSAHLTLPAFSHYHRVLLPVQAIRICTNYATPNRDLNPGVPVIGTPVYCENVALHHTATEAECSPDEHPSETKGLVAGRAESFIKPYGDFSVRKVDLDGLGIKYSPQDPMSVGSNPAGVD
ncbi:unnamed protein product, partial [Timema podura]|nr:unnamed protein product [Timema podura]